MGFLKTSDQKKKRTPTPRGCVLDFVLTTVKCITERVMRARLGTAALKNRKL